MIFNLTFASAGEEISARCVMNGLGKQRSSLRDGDPGVASYSIDLIGGKGGTRSLDPGIMRAVVGSR